MGELTNNIRKQYASLATAKGRKELNLFMAQGTKCVSDTIDYFEVHTLICTQGWLDKHKSMAEIHDVTLAKKADMERISTLSSAPDVIAVYKMPEDTQAASAKGLVIALDGVQGPAISAPSSGSPPGWASIPLWPHPPPLMCGGLRWCSRPWER